MSQYVAPPLYSSYPREKSGSSYGSAEQLATLGKAYAGVNQTYLLHLLLMASYRYAMFYGGYVGLCVWPILMVLNSGFGNLPAVRAVAEGKRWSGTKTTVVGVLMAFSPLLCFGIFGLFCLRSRVCHEFTRYGIHCGLLGPKKARVDAAIALKQVQQADSAGSRWRNDNFAVEPRSMESL